MSLTQRPVCSIRWLVAGLLWLLNSYAHAAGCIRLTGIVEDQFSHRPLAARLFAKSPDGRFEIGSSSGQTGAFSVDIPCQTIGLFVQQVGYRPQYIPIRSSVLRTVRMPITIIIPLLPVDAQDVDKPYLQTEQTHIEQRTAKDHHAQSRVDLFTIVDAQTNRPLSASTCFFFTKNGRRRCLNGTDSHPISIIFSEVDIIAIEVSSPGYQPYQGNLIVSELTGRSQQHIIRLVRELTLLSVRHNAANYHCELRRPNAKSPIPLTLVKGQPATFATYNVEPIPYTLVILDHTQTIREQRPITLTSGLNVVDVDHLPEATAGYTFNPDSLPPIYFEQSSFVLRSDAKTVLMQTTSYLNQHPALRLRITGHTDAEGDERLNQALSENRAKVVSSFLFAQGISDDRMILSGYGSRYPAAPNDSETTKIRNRRVQMKFENR